MPYHLARGARVPRVGWRRLSSSRTGWRRLLRRTGIVAWNVLRAVLLAGAAMGPSAPPLPPPPPQTIQAKAEDRDSEQDD